MKRIILIIITIFLCSAGYTQGYRNTYWGESAEQVLENPEIEISNLTYNTYVIATEKNRVLGQPTTIYYVFSMARLKGIGYAVDDTPKSRKALEKLFETRTMFIESRKKINMEKTAAENYKKHVDSINQPYAVLFIEDVLLYNQGAEKTVLGQMEKAQDSDKSEIEYINAEYGLDTEVNIYAGLVDGKIIIVYTQIPQDF